MKITARFLIVFLYILTSSYATSQDLKLAEIFNEGAVLQCNSNVSVWGKSLPDEYIRIEILGKHFDTKSDMKGFWQLKLSKMKAGGPFEMKVTSLLDTIKLQEIYFGEVWIAGGQSNMGWTLEKSTGGKEAIANAKNTNIRFVMVPYLAYEGDKNRGDMNWRTATTENVSQMSGVAYFFAKELQEKLKVPIGIICCYKGGSGAETWMSRESLLKRPELAPIVENYENYFSKLGKDKYLELMAKYESDMNQYRDSVKAGSTTLKAPKEPMGEQNYNRPYGLYNTMLKRVIPYSVKGAIWYQGEHNASRAEQYQTLFPAVIEQWRSDFKNPTMPFLFVQLANYDNTGYGEKPIWAELREAQLLTWQKVKNTGMAVSIDVGEKKSIHPTQKEPVGKRLAAIALNTEYDIDIPYSGPVCKVAEFKKDRVILTFNFDYKGLKVDGELKGFSICGKDKVFVPAKAEIKNNKVIVSYEGIEIPVALRYGWDNWTEANLMNSADLPATPFRTDKYPLLTKGVRTTKY
ncbi:MAG: sialate O-acetylesterase [Paludibacter sp.]